MNIDHVLLSLGNPILRLVSTPIADDEFGSSELKNIADFLFAIRDREHALGVAAPQIGISRRAIVFGLDAHPARQHIPSIPHTVLFNPSFTPLTEDMEEEYEGCLSVGELRGKVMRYKEVYYSGYDVEGNFIEREVSGLHARVMQHEIDHLEGIIFLDKVHNTHTLGFHDELIKTGVYQPRAR